MEKLINIGGKDVTLKASVFTQILYKTTFGKNMTADFSRATELGRTLFSDDEELSEEKFFETSGIIDEIYLQILWVLAKEGTPSIPTYEKWLRSIESIDLNEVMPAAMEVLSASMKVDRKNG